MKTSAFKDVFSANFYRKTVLLNNFLLFFLSGNEWDVATTSAIWLLRVRYCLSVNPLYHPEGPRGVYSSFRARFLSRRLILLASKVTFFLSLVFHFCNHLFKPFYDPFLIFFFLQDAKYMKNPCTDIGVFGSRDGAVLEESQP